MSDWTITDVRTVVNERTGDERPVLVMRDPVRGLDSQVVVARPIRVDELGRLAGFQWGDE